MVSYVSKTQKPHKIALYGFIWFLEFLYYKIYESKAAARPYKKNAETSALKIKNYCNCAATVLFLSNAWATSSVATVLIESPGMNARFAIRL